MELYCRWVKGVQGVVLGCQERGIAPPPARHVVGVVAIHGPPESLHLEADQSPEEPVNGMMCVYPAHSPESLHPGAGQSSEEQVTGHEVEALVSSSESVHPEVGPSSEKGKCLGRMTQDRALKHRTPSLRRALRVYSSLTLLFQKKARYPESVHQEAVPSTG